MNISKQLKNYRKEFNISQEQLAEVIHVSRQTISNWENGRSYPDIQSLILLSEYFKVSLDELVKGDVVKMKNQLEKNEMKKFSNGMLISFILMILSLPITKIFSPYFSIATVIFGGLMIWCAFKVEKIKKEKNLQTYKEILAYMETGEISEDKKAKESFKSKLLKGMLGFVVSGLLAYLTLAFFK